MSGFRRFGGTNFSASHNVIRSFISNSDQMNINNFSGLENTKETFKNKIQKSNSEKSTNKTVSFEDYKAE